MIKMDASSSVHRCCSNIMRARLRRRVTGGVLQYGTHYLFFTRLADVGCAKVQRLRPKFVVGEPVCAYDAQTRELTVQTLHFIWT